LGEGSVDGVPRWSADGLQVAGGQTKQGDGNDKSDELFPSHSFLGIMSKKASLCPPMPLIFITLLHSFSHRVQYVGLFVPIWRFSGDFEYNL
jgi:hypothetical protein